jgi:uncharacterized membrane protein
MLLAFAGVNSGFHKFVLVLHILSVIFGLGTVSLNGLYAAQAQKRQGPPGRAITEANFFVTGIAEYVIYTIPVWGILLVLSSDKLFKFSQTWIWLSLLLYFVAIGLSHAIMIPGVKRIIELQKEIEQGPPPASGPPVQVAELQSIGARLAPTGMVLDLLLVVIVVLMIWRPGL